MDIETQSIATHRVLQTVDNSILFYFWATTIKPSVRSLIDSEDLLTALTNSHVNSSLISIRALDDFFANKRRYKDDFIASDLPFLTKTKGFLTVSEREMINKNIAHFTHIRMTSELQQFNYRSYLERLIPVVGKLLLSVDACKNLEESVHRHAAGLAAECDTVWREYVQRK